MSITTATPTAAGPAPEAYGTILIGFLLGTLGFVSYTGGLGQFFGTGEPSSFTLWIPSWVGTILMVCGLLALNPKYLKHSMHAAAMIGLLGLLAALSRIVPKVLQISQGTPLVSPHIESFHSQIAMAVLCAVFVVMCVMSFVAARKRRQLANAGS